MRKYLRSDGSASHKNTSYWRQNSSNNRTFTNNYGRRSQGGRKQATFDPSHVILQSNIQQQQQVTQNDYQLVHQFEDFAVSQELKRNIAKKGFATPTPIQDQVIPHVLDGRDVVGIANTGTGKTAAFLIPLLDKVVRNPSERVLIIVPTRELALQVKDDLVEFARGMRIYATLCIGGASINRQIESLKRGQDFVIGTPGRIKDLNQRRKIKFEDFSNIVLDEVDRMLDMGFIHYIRAIVDQLPQPRQSLFFSATMTNRVEEIMRGFLSNPVHISVKTQDSMASVIQEVVRVQGRSKVDVLHDLLISDGYAKVLVFGRTKRGAEKLSKALQQRGFKVNAIHGNKSQSQRQRALREFKSNQLQALIATDVISRGLDIDNVTHVINYDLPESYEDYIHRIGRTGRANKVGRALTLVE